MDGKPVSAAAGRNKALLHKGEGRRGHGLRVIERNGYFHIYGRVRVGGRSIRIREGTGLEARPELREDAEAIRLSIESKIRADVIHGIKPSLPLALAADRYLTRPRRRPLGAASQRTVQEIVRKFRTRMLRDIEPVEWNEWVDIRHAGNSPSTRERFINDVISFLSWCSRRPNEWLPVDRLPIFDRDKAARNPNTRARRRVEELSPQLIHLMIENASLHLAAQLVTEWSTGARVSSILYGCRVCDLILAPGREQITFHDTKNGEPVIAALHPYAAEKLAEYLQWRGRLHDREGALFLTERRKPYTDNHRAGGGQNKTAFNAMKRRTAGAIRRAAAAEAMALWRAGNREAAWTSIHEARDKAALVTRVTQHWFRHMLATRMLQLGDLRSTMAQGGWLDPRSVMGYAHDVPHHRRGIVDKLDSPAPAATALEALPCRERG